jgi:small neutral amino acid transporter SnatA (MarC family)
MLIGIPIGLYGYLFPGNINLMVLEIYRSGKLKFLLVILGLILVFESIYCIASLTLLNSIKSNHVLYTSIESFSYLMIFLLGLWMLFEKKKDKVRTYKNTIYRGVLSIIIHPQQIPFWIVAGIIVNRFTHLTTNNSSLLIFVLCNAIGTTLAMLLYMFVGNKILNFFKFNLAQVNKVMGGIYILLVLYHLNPF